MNDNHTKDVGGRPTVMTPETLDKLRQAFLIGASDREAVLYADIAMSTLYDYQKSHPEFAEQKEKWKDTPTLKARQTVVKNLDDPEMALKYLERKKKDEFSLRQELTDGEGQPLVLFDLAKHEPNDQSHQSHQPIPETKDRT